VLSDFRRAYGDIMEFADLKKASNIEKYKEDKKRKAILKI
jgi:hypothetical protein